MLNLFCDRQTYYENYEDALRCMLQCANTRTEEEVTQGIIRDDAAVVAQLSGILKTVMCHFMENYITVLEYYDPADHGMEPYTRQEAL